MIIRQPNLSNGFNRLKLSLQTKKAEIEFLISLHGNEGKLIMTNLSAFLSDLATVIDIDVSKSEEFITNSTTEQEIEFDALAELLIKWEDSMPSEQMPPLLSDIEVALVEGQDQL
jgi:hypothetical protein